MTTMKINKIPSVVDMSLLDFLEHGDNEVIAAADRKLGFKTHRNYVCAVLKGRHRNGRILAAAFELALKRKGNLPLQAIKAA